MHFWYFLSDEIKPFLTHYFADKDENGIHIYSFSAEDSVIYLAETLDFLDRKSWSFNSEIYEQVSFAFEQEYVVIREEIIKIIGHPKFINDNFSDFKDEHQSDASINAGRRDIPLEFQMVDYMGEFKLTYWIVNQRVLYLTIAHTDKEESLNIALGSRPIRNL